MKVISISSSALKVGVVVFSITGVLVLSLLAYLAQDREVPLEDLGTAEGENVVTKGLLIGRDRAQDGSLMLLLIDGNTTAEAIVEKGGADLEAGSMLKLRGEVRAYGNGFVLEVASDRSLEVIGDGGPDPADVPWSDNAFGSVTGVVETSYWTGPGSFETVLRGNSSEGSKGPLRTVITCRRIEELPGLGDTVQARGLMREGGLMLCYGDGSLTVLMKAVPMTAELISLIDTISRDPLKAPVGPFTVRGYLRSEPGQSSYIAVGESPDGGRLNVRVRLPDGTPALHRGDLVELKNSTLYWDTDQARYGLRPEGVSIVVPYGPWKLDLGTAGEQLRYYVGSVVSISGTLRTIDGDMFLTDQGSVLHITNITGEMLDGATGTITGTLGFDGATTRLFMDAGKGVWTI